MERLAQLSSTDEALVSEIPEGHQSGTARIIQAALDEFLTRLNAIEDASERNDIIRALVCRIEMIKADRGLRHEHIGMNSGMSYVDYLLQYMQDQVILEFTTSS